MYHPHRMAVVLITQTHDLINKSRMLNSSYYPLLWTDFRTHKKVPFIWKHEVLSWVVGYITLTVTRSSSLCTFSWQLIICIHQNQWTQNLNLGVIRARKPPQPQHVLRQGGSPWGGPTVIMAIKSRNVRWVGYVAYKNEMIFL